MIPRPVPRTLSGSREGARSKMVPARPNDFGRLGGLRRPPTLDSVLLTTSRFGGLRFVNKNRTIFIQNGNIRTGPVNKLVDLRAHSKVVLRRIRIAEAGVRFSLGPQVCVRGC